MLLECLAQLEKAGTAGDCSGAVAIQEVVLLAVCGCRERERERERGGVRVKERERVSAESNTQPVGPMVIYPTAC